MPVRNYKSPPLYLHEDTNNTLVTTISQLVRKITSYCCFSKENYRTTIKCLDAELQLNVEMLKIETTTH